MVRHHQKDHRLFSKNLLPFKPAITLIINQCLDSFLISSLENVNVHPSFSNLKKKVQNPKRFSLNGEKLNRWWMSHHLDGGFSLLVEVKAFLCLVLILSPFRLNQKEVFLCRGQTAVSTCPGTAPYLDMAPPPPSPSNATRPTDAPSVSN